MFADTTRKRFVVVMLSGCLLAIITGIVVWKWEFPITPTPTADAGPPVTSATIATHIAEHDEPIDSAQDPEAATPTTGLPVTAIRTASFSPGGPNLSTRSALGAPQQLMEDGHLPLAGGPGLPLVASPTASAVQEEERGMGVVASDSDSSSDENVRDREPQPIPTPGLPTASQPSDTTDSTTAPATTHAPPGVGGTDATSGEPVPTDRPTMNAGAAGGSVLPSDDTTPSEPIAAPATAASDTATPVGLINGPVTEPTAPLVATPDSPDNGVAPAPAGNSIVTSGTADTPEVAKEEEATY